MRAAEVVLTDEQRATLRGWLGAGKTERRMAFRVQVILAIAEGLSNQAVAERVGTRPATASKWRGRPAQEGLSGLRDTSRSGKARQYQEQQEGRILAALDRPPPAGYGRRAGRLVEFLDLMTRVVAEHSGREIHVILDNLNTHKPKHDRWLARHKNVHFHFTPTHASWLNQVEVWFSILSAKALAGASFTSPRQVRDQIDAFIKAYNQTAHPFEWTKQVVFSQHPRP